MIKEIPLNGYTAQPSDMLCPDGELAAAVNVLPEDSGLKAILNPEIVKRMPLGSKVLASHKGDTFFNYIVIVSTTITIPGHSGGQPTTQTNSNIYWMDADAEFLADATHLISDGANIVHVNVIGNTLVLFNESSGLNYYLWRNGNYNSLGTQIPFPELQFSLRGKIFHYTRCYPEEIYGYHNGFITDKGSVLEMVLPDVNYFNGSPTGQITNGNQRAINEQVFAKVNKLLKEQIEDKDLFAHPFFVRYALRLYDGSLIMHSAPVLMTPSFKGPIVSLVGERTLAANDFRYWYNVHVVGSMLEAHLLNKAEAISLVSGWEDIVKSVDIFVSKPIYTYDSNGDCKVNYKGVSTGFADADLGKFVGAMASSLLDVDTSSMGFDFSVSFDQEAVLPHSVYNIADFVRTYISVASSGSSQVSGYISLPNYSADNLKERMMSAMSNFYLIKSIPVSSLINYAENAIFDSNWNVSGWTAYHKPLVLNDKVLSSLETRETMSDDYLSHDKVVARQSYAYNNRLNITQISRSLFPGFNPNALFAFVEYGSVSLSADVLSWSATPNGASKSNMTVDVYIKENGDTFKVTAQSTEQMAQFMSLASEACYHDLFVFYPNPNAFRMRITDYSGSTPRTYFVDLKQHDFLNGACAFFTYGYSRVGNTAYFTEPAVTNNSNKVEQPNKIYTSEVNNPFLFPARSINTVGTGRIVGIISATKALSQGQFGQFPLYAFTTEGVWAMEINNTGDFSAKQPVTRDIVFGNGESITQLDNAVLFATNRGIMLISGSQSVCISESIDDNDSVFSVDELPHIDELQAIAAVSVPSNFAPGSFRDFIRDCRMIYDYTNQRIIVYNAVVDDEGRKYPYAYIYSLKTKLWGMMLTDITSNFNSYPDAFAQDGNCNIVNISQPAAPVSDSVAERKAFIITRPFKLDAPHVLKTIKTIIVRGIFRREKVKVALYGSKDALQWLLVSSSTSHTIRNISGTPFKYFRLAIIAELAQNEILHSVTVEYEPRMTNRVH